MHIFSVCFLHNNTRKKQSTKCILNADETSMFSMGSNYCVSRVVESWQLYLKLLCVSVYKTVFSCLWLCQTCAIWAEISILRREEGSWVRIGVSQWLLIISMLCEQCPSFLSCTLDWICWMCLASQNFWRGLIQDQPRAAAIFVLFRIPETSPIRDLFFPKVRGGPLQSP